MTPSKKIYAFSNLLDKSSWNFFSYILLQYTHLNVSKLSLTVMYSKLDLQSLYLHLCRPSTRLSVRLDREQTINLALSMKLILYFMIFPFSCFSICTEKNINDNHSLTHCGRVTGLLLVSSILN